MRILRKWMMFQKSENVRQIMKDWKNLWKQNKTVTYPSGNWFCYDESNTTKSDKNVANACVLDRSTILERWERVAVGAVTHLRFVLLSSGHFGLNLFDFFH
jgi:hypothetical protein